jgi:parvulin-like peptidyl-prolyl isomerase
MGAIERDAQAAGRGRSGRKLLLVGGSVAFLAACLVWRQFSPAPTVSAKAPKGAVSGLPAADQAFNENAAGPVIERADPVAVVNRAPVTRNELAQQCMRRHGEDVLERMVNKRLIMDACKQRNIKVTAQEVDAEIDREAERFSIERTQWLKLLKQERGIKPEDYAGEIIWPLIALRKLAADRLTVTPAELQKEYETFFGPAVSARLIACDTLESAKELHAKAVAQPEEFGNLAKNKSVDANSAASKGLIQPIRMHMGDKTLENVAFRLKPGEISEIIQVANQFIFLKCEEQLAARAVPMAEVEKVLSDAIRDKKLRVQADQVFQELQQTAKIENVINDPAKQKSMPGVAALVNGHKITTIDLAEECIRRHGTDVLETLLTRKLLEQELKDKHLSIVQADIDADIRQAALAMNKTKPDGTADVEGWLAMVEEQRQIPASIYIEDAVWPSAALKKLVGDKIEISQEDIQRSFEANYGPRVRCLAIITDHQRRAQEAWEMARQNPTPEYFGKLSEQYSIDPAIRDLQGEIPPIQKWGGEPLLEEEAFQLKAGELSSVVQLGDRFVILLCLGQTEPTKVEFSEVEGLMKEDIHDKKLRMAMNTEYARLRDSAELDNYLTQTSQSPKRAREGSEMIKVGPRADRVVEGPRAGSNQPAPTPPVRR